MKTMATIENIRVDNTSGQIVLLDVLNAAVPGLHRQGTSRIIRRVLETFSGTPPCKTRVNSSGNPNIVGTLQACIYLLDNIPGEKWHKWRLQSANEFKKALTKHATKINKSDKIRESSVRDQIAELHNGSTEVWTPSGVIDVLTEGEVIEVKYYKNWQRGMGQVLAYGSHYPDRSKRLHLFAQHEDSRVDEFVKQAKSVCVEYGVQVTLQGTIADSKDTRKKRTFEDMPPWFKHVSEEEKTRYISLQFHKSMVETEMDLKKIKMEKEMNMISSCKKALDENQLLDERDKMEFKEKIKECHRVQNPST